ncbi:MAG: hypothetical protein J5545_13735, partial [Bacteroidaceae bacterium]|nr:hypothetical protein [Bacteroidaceae bacterium]
FAGAKVRRLFESCKYFRDFFSKSLHFSSFLLFPPESAKRPRARTLLYIKDAMKEKTLVCYC